MISYRKYHSDTKQDYFFVYKSGRYAFIELHVERKTNRTSVIHCGRVVHIDDMAGAKLFIRGFLMAVELSEVTR